MTRETRVFDVESVRRMLHRTIAAGVVRPETGIRDLAAVIVMTLSTVHPAAPGGADRKRYPALLIDGLRPAAKPLPSPSAHDMPGARR